VVIHSDDQFAQVGYFQIAKHHLEPKSDYDASLVSGGEVNVVLRHFAMAGSSSLSCDVRVLCTMCGRSCPTSFLNALKPRSLSTPLRPLTANSRRQTPWTSPSRTPLTVPAHALPRLDPVFAARRLTLLSGQFFVRGSVAPHQRNAEAVSTVESQLDQLFAAIKGI
jgi:hypothetical protein